MNRVVIPLLAFLAIFTAIAAGVVLILRHEIVQAGGIKKWVLDFPTTPGRIFVSIMLTVFFVTITMMLIVIDATAPTEADVILPVDALKYMGIFLLLMNGIDVTAYAVKRNTDHEYRAAKRGAPNVTGQYPVPPQPTKVEVPAGQSVSVSTAPNPSAVPPRVPLPEDDRI